MPGPDDRDQALTKLGDLIGRFPIATLTTIEPDGTLHGRPLAVQQYEPEGTLWFLTKADSAKVDEVRREHHVQVSFSDASTNTYACASGRAELVRDRDRIRQLWKPDYGDWFPGGPDDPNAALIRVTIDRAEYWDAPEHAWPLVAGFVALDPSNEPESHARVDLRDRGS